MNVKFKLSGDPEVTLTKTEVRLLTRAAKLCRDATRATGSCADGGQQLTPAALLELAGATEAGPEVGAPEDTTPESKPAERVTGERTDDSGPVCSPPLVDQPATTAVEPPMPPVKDGRLEEMQQRIATEQPEAWDLEAEETRS